MVRALGTRLVRLSLLSASVSAIAATAAPHAAHAQAVRSFDIPAQPLSSAILEFSRQSDVMIVVAPEATDGKRSKPLRATLPVNEAIAQLLKGTGLRAVANPAGGYSVGRESAQLRQGDAASFPLEEVRAIKAAEEEGPTIIVTGTRLATPGVSSPVPLISLTMEELPSVGSLSVGDSLDRMPQFRSTFNSNNSGAFNRVGTVGVNALDLRGLGTARTLTLINGRRQVSAIPGEFVLDVNSIPTGLIERVDIVTGGNSAVYGSDAIAGVVNFVTKRDFEGFRIDVRGGIDGRRTRGQVAGSFVAGTNFSDNRGNIAVAFDYSKVNPVHASERDDLSGFYSGLPSFVINEPIAGEPAAGDGIPDRVFYRGVRPSQSSVGGTVIPVCNAAVLADRARCTAAGYAQRYMFMPDGTLVAETPTIDFRELTAGSNVGTIGGLGYTDSAAGNIGNGVERFVVNLNAHYDVSDAFRPFVELKGVRVKSASAFQPSFWSNSLVTQFNAYRGDAAVSDLRCSNPFLSAQALSTLQSIGMCANVETGTFGSSRWNSDLGERKEMVKRDTWRAVAGVEGTFNDDWRYEVSFNYSKLKTRVHTGDTLYIPNFLRAVDAVRDGSGNIVCRVNADADPTNNDPACAPINVFGRGNASAAALDYVQRDITMEARASQFVASAYLAGDSSQLFELPGGPIGFVIGGEYRRETAYSAWDELALTGNTFSPASGLTASSIFDPPALVVKDVFGELSVPLLRDVPFAETLSVSASARMSDYETSAGTVWAWNVGGVWAPVRDIRFRAGYSQSVRVPNLLNLYAAETRAFVSVRDPCDTLYVNTGSTTRAANCLAAGLPADFANTIARTQTITALNGGNPDLEPETARSLTLGVVLQPRVVPGLTVTADYYKINLKSMIAPVTAQQILDNCYDAPTLDNVYCALVARAPSGLFALDGIRITTVNYARQKTRGIDMSVSYRRGFGDWRLDVNAVATRVLKLDNFTNVAAPTIPNRQLSELGDPKFTGNLNVNVGYHKLTFGWQFQYIGKMTIGTYEAQHSYAGQPPTNADEYADPWIKPVTYHNFRVELEANDSFTLYGGVDNAFDRKPPYSLSSQGSNASVFDVFGRSFYMGARAKF